MYLSEIVSIPNFFDKVLNTNEPLVDSIKVTAPYYSYQEILKIMFKEGQFRW